MGPELPLPTLKKLVGDVITRTQNTMDDTANTRKRDLVIIITLQVVWNVLLIYFNMGPIPTLNIPVLIATVLFLMQGRRENVSLQKVGKVLLLIALAKTVLFVTVFVLLLKSTLGTWRVSPNESKSKWDAITLFFGINALVDILTAFFCIRIVRRTNEYIELINRKSYFQVRTASQEELDL